MVEGTNCHTIKYFWEWIITGMHYYALLNYLTKTTKNNVLHENLGWCNEPLTKKISNIYLTRPVSYSRYQTALGWLAISELQAMKTVSLSVVKAGYFSPAYLLICMSVYIVIRAHNENKHQRSLASLLSSPHLNPICWKENANGA